MKLIHDPLVWVAAAGFLVTVLAVAMRAFRGLIISLAIGAAWPLIVWLVAVASVLLKDGGASASSRFTIWGGLGMGVTLCILAWVFGAMPATIVGAAVHALRNAVRRRGSTPHSSALG